LLAGTCLSLKVLPHRSRQRPANLITWGEAAGLVSSGPCNEKGPTMGNRTELKATRPGLPGIRSAAMLALLVVGSASVSAQEGPEYRGTQDQQMACMGDVFRLCSSEIPNVSRIVGCLQREKPQLTAACRAVFDQGAPRTAARHHHRVALANRARQRYERRSERAD
jgi:hypothetical protein